jgi:glycosyl transferase family 25
MSVCSNSNGSRVDDGDASDAGSGCAQTFGQIVVINLKARTDRLRAFEDSMQAAGIDCNKERVVRFEAIEMPQKGWLGCTRSHIAVLERAIAQQWPRLTVFEDDFQWRCNGNVVSAVSGTLSQLPAQFDVFLLDAFVRDSEPIEPTASAGAVSDIVRATATAGTANVPERVRQASVAAGYIVQQHYFATLLANFRESEALQEQQLLTRDDYHSKWWCALDQHWQWLQGAPDARWFTTKPPFGMQASGFSDIESQYVQHDYQRPK